MLNEALRVVRRATLEKAGASGGGCRGLTLKRTGFFGLEMGEDGRGLTAVDDGFETGGVGGADGLNAAKVAEETLHGLLADAGDFEELVGAIADFAALAVEGDGE